MHDRRVPGTRGNIDHLAIGPAGIFVIDAKDYRGSLVEVRDVGGWLRRDLRLNVGRRDRTRLVEGMAWQVEAVTKVLRSAEVEPRPTVTPVLCFLDAKWPLLFPAHEFAGVLLETPKRLRELLTRNHVLEPPVVDRLARVLATAFPPKVAAGA